MSISFQSIALTTKSMEMMISYLTDVFDGELVDTEERQRVNVEFLGGEFSFYLDSLSHTHVPYSFAFHIDDEDFEKFRQKAELFCYRYPYHDFSFELSDNQERFQVNDCDGNSWTFDRHAKS